MTKKTFVLDTNVLLHDPQALLQFQGQQIVIPMAVLEELDKMKRFPNELGKNARDTIRLLSSLKEMGEGNLHVGVTLPNHTNIRIEPEVKADTPYQFSINVNDHRILIAALLLQQQGMRVVFVSKDFAARIKAEAVGLEAEDYENLKYSYLSLYRGMRSISLPKKEIDLFYKDGSLPLQSDEYRMNEYLSFACEERSSGLGKFDTKKQKIEALLPIHEVWGIRPRNVQQRCAIDLLLRDDIRLVTLMGPAGTGKTLLALACAMHKVFDQGKYARILVSRPIVPLGRDIGYLPGTKEEKLFHWMQPIYDNLDILCSFGSKDSSEMLAWVMNSKKIEMEAVTYIRGRSLPRMYIIIDEAQNLTPHEVKTIISRAGEGTKVILAGDPTQIDNPYLDKDSNGLTYAVGKFLDHAIYGHLFLDKTERSELAALAAEIL